MVTMQSMHVSGLHSSRQAHLLRPCGVHRTHLGPRRAQLQPQALLSFFGGGKKRQQANVQPPAVKELLSALEGTERGLSASTAQQATVFACVEELREQKKGEGGRSPGGELSATWRLLYTTEKVSAQAAQQDRLPLLKALYNRIKTTRHVVGVKCRICANAY